jgi:hypothetical protein
MLAMACKVEMATLPLAKTSVKKKQGYGRLAAAAAYEEAPATGGTHGASPVPWGEPMTGEGKPRHMVALAAIDAGRGLIMRVSA